MSTVDTKATTPPTGAANNDNNSSNGAENCGSASPRTTLNSPGAMVDMIKKRHLTEVGSPPTEHLSTSTVPPRKRSKVSRACDECRRKKIRCDAVMEDEQPHCTSCKRAGEKCSFSRVPMKRGPSKRSRYSEKPKIATSPTASTPGQGNNEFVLHTAGSSSSSSNNNRYNHAVEQNQPSLKIPTPPPAAPAVVVTSSMPATNNNNNNNNRLPSIEALTSPPMSESNCSPTFTGGRDPSPISSYPRASYYHNRAYSSSNQQHNANYPSFPRHPSVSSDSSVSSAYHEVKRYSEPDEPGWDDRCIDSYYQVVHPALPILPASKVRLRSRLLNCHNATLRHTLLCGVNGLLMTNNDEYKGQILQGILSIQDLKQLSFQSKILYLSSLILLFLQTGESPWLGTAISVAYDMRLHCKHNYQFRDSEDDQSLSRRLFLILVILDRLHSVSKSVPTQIPDDAIHLNPEYDNYCFSSAAGMQVTRLCMILGHKSRSSPHLLFQELEQAYQSIESMWDTSPILKAMYYLVLVHFDVVSIQKDQSAEKQRQILANTLNDASVLTTLLESPLLSVSPLIGYFMPPLVGTLMDLVAGQLNTRDMAGTRHQFIRQLEYIDQLIDRRFGQFSSLRHDIHAVLNNAKSAESSLANSSASSPRCKLEGLAAVAQAQAI